MISLPYAKRPCKDCPFRKDSLKGWLGKERIVEIMKSDSFVCHKTTDGNDNERKQCAGHMTLLKNKNAFWGLANTLKIELKLKADNLIFDNERDCIEHHS